MTDPLSVAAGVAGLVALAGSTSKVFYQFFHSIQDAPNAARGLASGLFSLNVVLSQVQEVLLSPDFVQQSEDHEAEALDGCLSRCTRLLRKIEKKVEKSGLTNDVEVIIRKTWASVRWSFNEDELTELRRQADEEKANLGIVLNAFTARMTVGLLGEVKQLQALAEEQGQMLRKQNRMIEDVHVILQFKVDHSGQGQPVSSSRLEYSAFTASEAYSRRSLAHLLMPSNSMLNLRIGDLQENSISAIWEPDPGTRVPIRRVQSRLSFEEPDIHNPEQLRTAFSIKSPSQDDITSSKELLHMVDLSKIASNIKKCRQHKAASKKAQVLRSFLSALDVVDSMNLNWPLGNLTPLWGAIRIVVEITYRIVGVDSIVEDLRDIADTLPMIELAARELEDRDTWTPLVADVHSAASEYVQFAASFLQKKRARVSVSLTGAATRTDMRQELREKFDIAYKRFRRSYDIISRSQLLRQQREVAEEQQKALETQRHLMIESQEQRKATDAQIQLILDSQKSLISPQSDTKPRNQDIETALVLEDTD